MIDFFNEPLDDTIAFIVYGSVLFESGIFLYNGTSQICFSFLVFILNNIDSWPFSQIVQYFMIYIVK